jgi:HEAT repeat protein
MAKQLHKGDEERRRWNLIDASRAGDRDLLPQLLARLDSDETVENKRHVVRALGNIGGPEAEAKLLELLTTESGLILGDLANALGRLRLRAALPALKELKDHPLEWVRQNVAFAERRLEGE